MLRKALGETPDGPRYTVTVSGRGYRLAESVRLVAPRPTETAVLVARHSEVHIQIRESRLRTVLAVAALILVALGSVVLWKFSQGARPLTARDTIVLADFANSSGDPVFDGNLRQGIAVELQQSPSSALFLTNASGER